MLKNIFIVFLIFGSFSVFAEKFSYVVNKNGKELINTFEFNHLQNFNNYDQYKIDSVIGAGLPVNTKIFQKLAVKNGPVIFETQYDTNAFGFRILNDKKAANQFLIMAGDSNTLGEGVKDEETLPYLLSKNFANFHVYNWGRRGGGPHDLLAFLERLKFENEITEQAGTFIYHFIPSYMWYRVIGSKTYMTWGVSAPYYELNAKNEIEFRGTFDNKWTTTFYLFLNRFEFLKNLFPELPRLDHRDMVKTAKIFAKIKTEFQKKFPATKFLVVIDNCFNSKDEFFINDFQKELDQLKIEHAFIPYSVLSQSGKEVTVPYDGHLNGEGIRLITPEFIKIIQSSGLK